MDTTPFDLARMFIGDLPPLFFLEIAVRTFLMYLYTLLAVRFVGKRSFGQLTLFDFLVVIMLGSAAGDPMFYEDVPLVHGFVVITVVVLVERMINFFTNRSKKLETYVEGVPTLVIRDGKVLDDVLRSEEISRAELMMQLRKNGVRSVGEVDLAYLELSGELSVFKRENERKTRGESTLPRGEEVTDEA